MTNNLQVQPRKIYMTAAAFAALANNVLSGFTIGWLKKNNIQLNIMQEYLISKYGNLSMSEDTKGWRMSQLFSYITLHSTVPISITCDEVQCLKNICEKESPDNGLYVVDTIKEYIDALKYICDEDDIFTTDKFVKYFKIDEEKC